MVLMTAVEDEYRMARKVFQDVFAENYKNGFKYCLANYIVNEELTIIIAIFRQNNMGLVSASMTATFALNKFNPKLLLMCGVCAGVKDKANLGDLIIFSPVFDYGSGKYQDGNFFPDYRQHHINSIVDNLTPGDRNGVDKVTDIVNPGDPSSSREARKEVYDKMCAYIK